MPYGRDTPVTGNTNAQKLASTCSVACALYGAKTPFGNIKGLVSLDLLNENGVGHCGPVDGICIGLPHRPCGHDGSVGAPSIGEL